MNRGLALPESPKTVAQDEHPPSVRQSEQKCTLTDDGVVGTRDGIGGDSNGNEASAEVEAGNQRMSYSKDS